MGPRMKQLLSPEHPIIGLPHDQALKNIGPPLDNDQPSGVLAEHHPGRRADPDSGIGLGLHLRLFTRTVHRLCPRQSDDTLTRHAPDVP